MKRLIVPIIGLVVACGLSAFIALVSFGMIEGVVFAVNPGWGFALVTPLTCPRGVLDYQQYHASYNQPGENQFSADCISGDGTRTDITLQSIGYLTVLSYLACFVPVFIVLGLAGFFIPLLLVRVRKKDRQAEI